MALGIDLVFFLSPVNYSILLCSKLVYLFYFFYFFFYTQTGENVHDVTMIHCSQCHVQ